MSGEIPTYPYEEEDSPEFKIKHLTSRVEELESTNRALRNELSRDMQASGEAQLAAVRDAVASTDDPAPLTFEQAWALKEAEGYQYGEDALEQVRMGWEMAKGER